MAIVGLLVFFLILPRLRPPPKDLLPATAFVVETAKAHVCLHTLLENEVEEIKIKQSLELARELGATTIVQFFPWAYVEEQDGHFGWGRADRIVRHAEAQGFARHRSSWAGSTLGERRQDKNA